jgi:hypothetical protein
LFLFRVLKIRVAWLPFRRKKDFPIFMVKKIFKL